MKKVRLTYNDNSKSKGIKFKGTIRNQRDEYIIRDVLIDNDLYCDKLVVQKTKIKQIEIEDI